jgi:hypothetical protein
MTGTRLLPPEAVIAYAFPDIHWHKIRTNNPLERIMREIRRRTRVVGAFPVGPVVPQPGGSEAPLHRRDRLVRQYHPVWI